MAAVAWGAVAQEDERFVAEIDGRKDWTIRYGIGSPLGLASAGVAAGALTLDQTLAVDLEVVALSILTLEAHFDDSLPENLQSIALYLDTERLDGVLGDFVVDQGGPFIAFRRSMQGLRLDYQIGAATLTGFASRFEGTTASKTFVGQTTTGERLFEAVLQDRPWIEVPYVRHLDGLYAFPLRSLYVKEFAEVELVLAVTPGLRSALTQAGLDALTGEFEANAAAKIESRAFDVLENEDQILLLADPMEDLLRDRVSDAIDAYNSGHSNADDDPLDYPFVEGSESEDAFLALLAPWASISVDGDLYPIEEAVRRRYYDLGNNDVVEGSLTTQIRLGTAGFRPITDSAFVDYSLTLYPEAGIVEFDFPDAFFEDEGNAAQISYSRRVTQGTYMLGLNVIPGSERVMVNGILLERDMDYTIEYEVGMVLMMVEVAENDVVQIDYERFASGLGGGADYARYLFGLALDLPVSDALHLRGYLLREADDPDSAGDPDRVTTMPNRHTVGGVAADITLDGFSGGLVIGYNEDRFPPGDNERIPSVNEIMAIAVGKTFTFVGHAGGLSVESAGDWKDYGTGDGLSGREVRAILVEDGRAYLGTSAGLTVIDLSGASPLDQVGNWTRYTGDDRLPDPSIRALAMVDDVLWMATDEGLASVGIDALDDAESWQQYVTESWSGLASMRALSGLDGDLYIGTLDGLYRYEISADLLEAVAGTGGESIRDLAANDGRIYVASERGLRTVEHGAVTGWEILGPDVLSVAVADDHIYYGTSEGLGADGDEPNEHAGWAITALAADPVGGLWAGSRADTGYEIMVWYHGEAVVAFDHLETRIDGRDTSAYQDIPGSQHTVESTMIRADFRRSSDGFTLSGLFETVSPGFRLIGGSSRSAATSWDLDVSVDVAEGVDLSASHGYGILGDGEDDQRSELTNSATLTWDFGPRLTVGVQHESVNNDLLTRGPETGRFGYSLGLRDGFFDDRLDLSLTWRDTSRYDFENDTVRRDTQLAAEMDLSLLPGLSIDAGWSRPVRIRATGWTGSEKRTVAVDWTQSLSFGRLTADYALAASRPLPEGAFELEHDVDAGLSFDAIAWDDWRFTPRVELGAHAEDGAVDIDGLVRLTTSGHDLRVTTTLDAELSGIGERVQRWTQTLKLAASYSGIQNLRPSLNYTMTKRQTLYEGGDQDPTIDHSATGRLSWTPESGARDNLELSFSLRGPEESRRLNASLENSYQMDLTPVLEEWVSASAGPDRSASPDGEVVDGIGVDETSPGGDVSSGGEAKDAVSGEVADLEPVVDGTEVDEDASSIEEVADVDEASPSGEVAASPDGDAGEALPNDEEFVLPSIWLRTVLTGDLEGVGGELDPSLSLSAALDVSWLETWSGTLAATYSTGAKKSGGLYHSLLLEMTFAIDF